MIAIATISSTLKLNDQMSKTFSTINKAMSSTLSAMKNIEGVKLGPEFAQAAADVKLAERAIEQMNDALQDVPGKTQQVGDGFTVMKGLAVNAIASIANDIKNKLTSGIDKALARIDTMEQFSRTMTTLTGSADAAAGALESIRQTVTGTAYGLDAAAQAVQSFVTSGMSIDTATSQIAALADAVAFYGDGTNESLQSVADAWSKMATSGKVSAERINMLTDRGIPVYQIYASAVGKSVADVQKSFTKGEVSAAQFQEVIASALMDGTAGFASVQGAAQAAGASWSGVFDNMGAAVSRGWVNIITAIDDALASAGFPKLREIIASIGSAMEQFLNFIASHVDVLVGIAAGITGAAVALGIYTAAQWIATGAAQAFFTTLLANPLTWIALAIGVVVMQIFKWIQAVGGIQIAWMIVQDYLLNAWANLQIAFMTFVYGVMTMWGNLQIGFYTGVYYIQDLMAKMGLAFARVAVAAANSMGDMKVNVLTILQNMVNGAIGIINDFISAVNSVLDVGIEAVAEVTFATTAALENESRKATENAALKALESEVANDSAERQASLNKMQQDAAWDALKRDEALANMRDDARRSQAERQANIAARQSGAGSGAADAAIGASVGGIESTLDDLKSGSGSGSALKTTGDVNISGEDIKMLLDLAAMGYQVHYQTLTPQLSLNIDTIRENVDVDYVIQEITTAITEVAESRVVLA